MSASNFGLRARALTGGEAAGSTAAPASTGGGGSSRQGKSVAPGSTSFLSTRRRANSELVAFKDSILDTLGKTDLRAIDEGLGSLSSAIAETGIDLGSFSDDEEDEEQSDSSSAAAVGSGEGAAGSSTDAGGGREKGTRRLRNNGKTTVARREMSALASSQEQQATRGGVGAVAAAVAAAAAAAAAVAAAEGTEGPAKLGGRSAASKRKAASSDPLKELARASSEGMVADDDSDDDERDSAPWAVIKIRSETEIVKSLDPRFFTEDYDPVVRILDDLPDVEGGKLEGSDAGGRFSGAPSAGALDAVAGGDPSGGRGDAGWSCDEYLERQLRDMDVARLAVTRQIASMIQENYTALVGGMRQVQAVDLDLARAGVQISNGRRALQKSMARVTGPVIRVVHRDRRRDNLEFVRALAAACLEAVATEGRIEGLLADGRFTQAVATAEQLSETVTADQQLSTLAVLSGVRERTGSVIHTVRERAKFAVAELCQTFSPERYGGIITAFMMLEDRGALMPPPPSPPPVEEVVADEGTQGGSPSGAGTKCRWISKGLADCALPLPRSLVLLAPNPGGESLPGVNETAAKNEGQVGVESDGKVSGERGSLVLSDGGEATGEASADGGDASVGPAGVDSQKEDNRTGMEMLADHMLACFVEEFDRRLSDAIFEAQVADQGMDPAERRRRGPRRAFEPPPPLFLPAPQLLDGIVQICHGAAELLHTHFCCTQWHASAFDERLEDDAFLHTADAQSCSKPPSEPDPSDALAPGTYGSVSRTEVRMAFAGLGSAAGAAEPLSGSASGGGGIVSGVAGAGFGFGVGAGADSRVKALHDLLVAQGRVLWEAMESKMIKLLSEASVSGGALELEDLAGVVGAVGLFATLGDEFIGAERPDQPAATEEEAESGGEGAGKGERRNAGRALRECLSDMAKKFFQGANKEGVTVLKQMLEMEAWQRVPIPLKPEDGGIGGLIDSNAQRFCSPHRVYRGIREPYLHLMHDVMSLHEDANPLSPETNGKDRENEGHEQDHQHQHQHSKRRAKPLLRGWHRSGNPFKILGPLGVSETLAGVYGAASNAVANATAAVATALDGKSAVAGVGFGRLPLGMDVDDDPDQALSALEATKAEAGYGKCGRDTRNTAPFGEELEQEERRYGSGWVVTQAALNGVARYAGHALQIMALVRPAAPSAFEGLRQLVDLYLYCAFTLFTPQWAIDGLYGFGEDELVPPPEEQERLATLKSFMSRVSHELTNRNGGGGGGGMSSVDPSPHHSPERSRTSGNVGGGGKSKTPVMSSGGGSEPRAESTRRFLRSRTRSRHALTPTRQPDLSPAARDANAVAADAEGGGSEASIAETAANSRDRGGRDGLDFSPVGGSLTSPGLAGRGRGEGGTGDGAAPSGGSGESILWPFRGSGDSPPRSRTGSNSGPHGLFSRRSGRHPTPRAPISLPSCVAQPPKSGDIGLLFAGSEAFWGGANGDDASFVALQDMMEWRSLGQRAVAVESCIFVVQVLKAARRRTLGLGLLPVSQRAAVDAYVGEVEQAAAQLRRFMYTVQGAGLAGGPAIAAAAEGQTWTVKQFRNDAHPYVEKCIARCRVVHEAIYGLGAVRGGAKEHGSTTETSKSIAPGKAGRESAMAASDAPGEVTAIATVTAAITPGRGNSDGNSEVLGGGSRPVVPARARTLAWTGVVDAALLSLLRGFSRAKRCSTEGRALMSMDLQALALGLGDPAAAQATKAHVHAYVNAFYFGDEDLLAWIKERWRSYPMHQMVSLLQCGDGSAAAKVLRKRRVRDLVAQVESLYLPWNTALGAPAVPVNERTVGAGVGVGVANGVGDPSLEALSSSSSAGVTGTVANATATAVSAVAFTIGTSGVRSTASKLNSSE